MIALILSLAMHVLAGPLVPIRPSSRPELPAETRPLASPSATVTPQEETPLGLPPFPIQGMNAQDLPTGLPPWRSPAPLPPASALTPTVPPLYRPNAKPLPLLPPDQDARLHPPRFSAEAIPRRPKEDMDRLLSEDLQAHLRTDLLKAAVPLASLPEALAAEEAPFRAELAADLADGRLDMPFARFMISAEYFHARRVLAPRNLQPAFTLAQSLDRFQSRLRRMADGLPERPDRASIETLLQRYAEGKFYSGPGSGLLLDSLHHDLIDCESGSKEILAYLDALYPDMNAGTNRGLLSLATGGVVGHMQVYLFPSPETNRVLQSPSGVVIETTRVSANSIQPHVAGDLFPKEDFVFRFYPELSGKEGVTPHAPSPSLQPVGLGSHPLKMAYNATDTALAIRPLEPENLLPRRLTNEFFQSPFAPCDPGIDPVVTHDRNLFSNFVAMTPALRQPLMAHYLAAIPYWDNRVLPVWEEPAELPGYDGLAVVLASPVPPEMRLRLGSRDTVAVGQFASHRRFLEAMRQPPSPDPAGLGQGETACTWTTALTGPMLDFLFTEPLTPGVFLLPDVDGDFSWDGFVTALLNDCIAPPEDEATRGRLHKLATEAAKTGTSLRGELLRRAVGRGLGMGEQHPRLSRRRVAIESVLAGEKPVAPEELGQRRSEASTLNAPSVRETVESLGRTGISPVLFRDLADLTGGSEAVSLLRQYAARTDLDLSLSRASALVLGALAAIPGPVGGDSLLRMLASAGHDGRLRIAAGRELLALGLVTQEAWSRSLVSLLEQEEEPPSADLLAQLAAYGLLPEDAAEARIRSIERILARLPRLSALPPEDESPALILRLIQLAQAEGLPKGHEARKVARQGLAASLRTDLGVRQASPRLDYGIVATKLAALAFLRDGSSQDDGSRGMDAKALLAGYIPFARLHPAGRALGDLLLQSMQEAEARRLVRDAASEFLTQLSAHPVAGGVPLSGRSALLRPEDEDRLLELSDLAGDALVLSLLLARLPDEGRKKAFEFLTEAHRTIAHHPVFQRKTAPASGDSHPIAASAAGLYDEAYYLREAVESSFGLLAALTPQNVRGKVQFRKIRTARELLQSPLPAIAAASRLLTRQDLSLLTLHLNPANPPKEIARAWRNILAVTEKLLPLAPAGSVLGNYLFAPHAPYLTEDDSGFLFPPETVEDLRQARNWGPKSDIVLASYLYFRNLPIPLPDWLLDLATARSAEEAGRIRSFEAQGLTALIRECEQDAQDLPEGLFTAKWKIRKPFGEDAFPGTLLLLRTGDLVIDVQGSLRPSRKTARP